MDPAKVAAVRDDIETFVHTILQEAQDSGATIYAIQLGNEYPGVDWTTSSGVDTKMTAKQYGQVANELAKITQSAIDDFNAGLSSGQQDPKIVAQVWGDYNEGGLSLAELDSANIAVLGEFDADGLAAIDAISSHLYFKEMKSSSAGELHEYGTLSDKIIDMITMTDVWDEARRQGSRRSDHGMERAEIRPLRSRLRLLGQQCQLERLARTGSITRISA